MRSYLRQILLGLPAKIYQHDFVWGAISFNAFIFECLFRQEFVILRQGVLCILHSAYLTRARFAQRSTLPGIWLIWALRRSSEPTPT